MEDHRKYLRPDVISRLGSIDLKARLVVEGFITGLHRSPFHGFSVEFAQHRQYMPGDEIRHIDWKIWGKTNRFYVKQYEEETNLRCTLVVDSSASMAFASDGNISKFDYARYLAGALAYLMTRQADAIGLALYDTEVRTFMPARSKGSWTTEILKTIGNATPSNATGTGAALNRIAERIGRRGLIVIISDLFDKPESIAQALKHFRHRQHEVVVFQLLDPRERDFNFGWDATFRDMETGEEMITQPYQVRKAYEQAVAEHCETMKKECRSRNVDYHLIDTSQPFDVALLAYLNKRRTLVG